ncbi:MAG TPA: hypothetical protein PKD37_06685 [Oligoflexia bacterium]|nr:hypothetical protein [Oligoflexia bacterium]HMP27648.1 hypothetical protein [Oligoflexia bacterium]
MEVNPLWFLIATAVMALAPLFIGVGTAFIKVSVVLTLLRSGLNAQQVPSNFAVGAISLAVSLFVMSGVINTASEEFFKIDLQKIIDKPTVENISKLKPIAVPWIDFIRNNTNPEEIKLLLELDHYLNKKNVQDTTSSNLLNSDETVKNQPNVEIERKTETQPSLPLMISAYVLSELKQGFIVGTMILLPFLVIDLVVSNVLVALGMVMLSPNTVALPLKLLVFLLIDGWHLLFTTLVRTY